MNDATNEQATATGDLMMDQLREVTGVFVVSCGLPPLTRKVETTTREINDERGTQGDYTHDLLPKGIVTALTKWANAARYLRKAHGGLQVGDRYLVPLSRMVEIQKDIVEKQEEIDNIVAHVEKNWVAVQNYVVQVLGPLNDQGVMLYGGPGGLETFKADISFKAEVLPLPPSGVGAIPTAFAGEQQDAVLNHLKVQDEEFRKSISGSLSGDLSELHKRIEARILWLNAGATGTPPRPRISKRFVEGIQHRSELVLEISNGLVPEIATVCNQWGRIAPALMENLEGALDSAPTCESLKQNLEKMIADAG